MALIAYDKLGSGPPVVFLHSGLADRGMWEPQRDAFAARYTCYFVDSPGYGASDDPPSPFSYPTAIAGFIESFVQEKAAMVGSSYGAGMAFDTALAAPQWTGPLVLVNGKVTDEPVSQALVTLWEEADAAWEREDHDRAVELEIEGWVDGHNRPGGKAAPEVRDYFTGVNRAIWERHSAHPLPELLPGPDRDCSRIHQPVLLIDGPYDFSDIRSSNQLALQRFPSSEYVSIAGAAHFPSREQPEAFNRMALDFLDRVWGNRT